VSTRLTDRKELSFPRLSIQFPERLNFCSNVKGNLARLVLTLPMRWTHSYRDNSWANRNPRVTPELNDNVNEISADLSEASVRGAGSSAN
jgi:hypothetical protein